MKAISAIVFSFFLGVGSAGKLVEQRDRQLVYQLRGETVVGIPLKGTQGQAVQVDQTVKITRQDQRTFILQSENIVVNGLKNELSDAGGASKSSSSESSSQESEEQTLPLSEKIREILESPVEVIVTNQKVSAFRVKSGTPTWARNIFRGLLTHFHFVFEQMGDLPVGGSSPENEFEIERQSSIFGTCPTKYKEYNLGPVGNSIDAVAKKLEQVFKEVHLDQSAQSQSSSSFQSASNESASSSSSSEELQQRLPQFVRNFNQETAKKMCEEGDKYMVILKILNMTGCSEVRSLSMGHPAVEVNNTNPLYERQVVILNFGCGMGPGDFKALGVLGADTLNVGFPQSELPSMKQVTTQISQLKEVREGKAQPPERPLLVQSLHYEFVQRLEAEPRSAAESKSDSQSAENNEVEGRDSDEDLEHPGLSTLIIDPKNRGEDELANILKENLREITKIFKESHPQDESLDVHKVMDLYRAVIRIVRLLPKTKLINLYSSLSVEGKSTNNRGLYTLYFNALLIAGTGPSLAAVDKFFRNDNIDPVQKAHYLISFPQYARRPTRALIRMFKETTEQALRKEAQILRNSALLSLASVTYQACVNSRIGRAKYPVEIYGRGCGPNFARDEVYAFLGEKLWPGIMASGNDEQKSVLITAVSLLGLPDSVQLFEKVIQDEHQSDFIRTKAVFGYKRLIHSSNGNDAVSRHFVENTVIPNLLKHTEEVGGRDGRPSTVQMAAGSLLFVCEHSRIQEWDRISTAAIKSRNPEVQKFVGTALTSIAEMNSPVNANHLRMKKIATEMVNKEGVLLSGANAVSMNIFRGTTINEKAELEFYSRFAALKSYKSNNDFLHLYSMGSYELGADPLSVTPLNIQLSFQATRAQDIWKSSKVYAQLSGWDSAFFATQLDAQSFTTLLKSTEAGRIFAIWLSEKDNNGLRNQVERINVQKAIQPVELVKEVPTMMGYPVVFRTSNPLIFSTVGQIGIKGSQQNNRVQADLYITMGAQVKARLVAKVPYSMQEIEVGFEKNIAVELPFRLIAQKGREEGEVTIAVTPTHLENGGEPTGEIRVVSIDQLPFTAVVNDPLAKSLDEKYQKFQSIRTGSQIPREEFQFGKDSFGLNFNFEEERDKGTEHSLKFQKVLYKNQNVTLDLGQSRTNTIIFSLAYGEAQNMDEQREEKDEISSSSSISGESTQQSQSRTGGNIKNGLVVMGAVVGKKTFIPSLGQRGTPNRESKDVIEETQGQNKGKSTFQVLFKGISDKKSPQNVFVEVALGNAADEAAKYLPKIPGAEVVKRIITQADNSQEQSSLCFQIDHTARANSQPSQTNDWAATFKSQVRLGKSCNKLEEVEFRTVINNAMNEIKTRVQIKGVNGESGQLKAALSHLQNTLERSWENQSKHPRRSGLREVYSDDEGNVHLKWVVDNSLDRASLEERRAFATKPTRRPLHFDESPL